MDERSSKTEESTREVALKFFDHPLEQRISNIQRNSLMQTMTHTVAYVRAEVVLKNRRATFNIGTGVFINDGKVILTCHQNVQPHMYNDDTMRSTNGCFFATYEAFREMKVARCSYDASREMNVARCSLLDENEPNGLAILNIDNPPSHLAPTGYAELATEDVFVGQEVHVISHVAGLNFTCDSEMISIPTTSLGDLELDCDYDKELLRCSKSLEIMDITGLTSGEGMLGAPVFNSRGAIVGIVIATYRYHCRAVPLKVLQEYISTVIGD